MYVTRIYIRRDGLPGAGASSTPKPAEKPAKPKRSSKAASKSIIASDGSDVDDVDERVPVVKSRAIIEDSDSSDDESTKKVFDKIFFFIIKIELVI